MAKGFRRTNRARAGRDRLETTLLDLIGAFADELGSDRQAIEAVAHLIRTGRVSSARGLPVVLSPGDRSQAATVGARPRDPEGGANR